MIQVSVKTPVLADEIEHTGLPRSAITRQPLWCGRSAWPVRSTASLTFSKIWPSPSVVQLVTIWHREHMVDDVLGPTIGDGQ